MTGEARPKVSVVIPTTDRSDYLREALASVRAVAGADIEIELIISDNGDSAGVRAVAGEFGAVYVQARRPGASAARNAGLRVATGDYVAFLDDDDVWMPQHLRPHLALLARDAGLGAAVGQVQLAGHDLTPIGDPYPPDLPADGDVFTSFFTRTPQIGATVARIGVRETVGYFDEELLSSEDWDWHLRLALAHRVGFVPQPSILFRQRPFATHDELQWMRLGYSRRVLFRNLRRAKGRRPSAAVALRTLLRFRGGFYWYFAHSAVLHGRSGNRRAMRQSFVRAMRSSPLHAGRDCLRQSEFRTALMYVLGLKRGAPGADASDAALS